MKLDQTFVWTARDTALAWMACLVVAASAVSCSKSPAPEPEARGEVRTVKIARVITRPLERSISVSGSLAAHEQATLSVKVPGRLAAISVDLGSTVKKSEVIARLEPRDYELRVRQAEAALAEARAAVGLSANSSQDTADVEEIASVKQARAVLEEARKNRERVQKLSAEGISSQSELDTVETAYLVAYNRYQAALEDGRTRLAVLTQREADLEVARQQLADTSVRAPFDGAVQTRLANTGEFLPAGTPLASIVRLDPLRLRLEISEREALLVQTGQVVRITVDGVTNQYRGRLERISPAITEENRMLLVEADVPLQGVLRPGLFVRAAIIVDEHDSALVIPSEALITFAGIEKVVAVEDGIAREKEITTGRRAGEWIEVTGGLRSNDVVVLGPGNLRTGEKVNVVNTAEFSALAERAEAALP